MADARCLALAVPFEQAGDRGIAEPLLIHGAHPGSETRQTVGAMLDLSASRVRDRFQSGSALSSPALALRPKFVGVSALDVFVQAQIVYLR